VKRASKGKRRSKAIPVLGAAGLSLALASEASLASTAPALDTMTRNAGLSHEFTRQAASENTYSPPVYSPPIRPPHRPVRKKR
jgi:hypothetical protein